MKAINLSPSFLSKLYDKGYDYAVGEKLGLIKKDTKSMSDGRLIHSLIAERLAGEPSRYNHTKSYPLSNTCFGLD